MAEDGLLPPIFAKTNKGNPTAGIVLNAAFVALLAGFVPFSNHRDDGAGNTGSVRFCRNWGS